MLGLPLVMFAEATKPKIGAKITNVLVHMKLVIFSPFP